MDSLITQLTTFIHSKQFWLWHGFVLSGLWVIVSALAILAKRFSTIIHLLLFATVDFTTLFFAGAALYRVYPSFANFSQWSIIKKGHVLGGISFIVIMILQHVGGALAFHTGKPNPLHRKFGRYVATIGRIIAGFGWVLGGHRNNAIIVGIATVLLLIISAMLPSKSGRKGQEVSSSTQRSKSPRAKRQ